MTALIVFTDKSFPRDSSGEPDLLRAADYIAERGGGDAAVVLIADNYPGLRDEALLDATSGYERIYLSTTRQMNNSYEVALSLWLHRRGFEPAEVIFYGKGLWA
ncbi:hypothetical protein [Microbacterium sp. GXF6406]